MTARGAVETMSQMPRYVTHEADAVEAFLACYPFLRPLLREAITPLEDAFGSETPLVIALERDPEVAGWVELRVDVTTPLSVEEADRRLHAFDTAWWLAHLPEAQGKLFFTLAFG
jgi:hypothetical protein